jgi:hypothetical protein
METDEGIPEDAVWFDPDDFRVMLREWVRDYEGIRYANDAMDKAHGDWHKTKET